MKKMKIALLLCVFSATSAAMEANLRPYAGGGLRFMHVHYGTEEGIYGQDVFSAKLPEISLDAGVEFNPYLRLEVGYSISNHQSKRHILGKNEKSSLELATTSVDLIGAYPIDLTETFFLLGAFGMQRLSTHMDADYQAIGFRSYRGSEHESRPRLGLGAEWNYTPYAALRLMSYFQEAKLGGIAHDMNIYEMSLQYKF